jgi:hypothetical protein
MKRANKLMTPALFAIGAVAQSGSSILGSSTVIINPSDTGVVYETYSICPTTEVATIVRPTMTCPGPYCTGLPTNAPGDGSSTIWVTELIDVCPTATDEAGWLTTMTTTITEACPCSEETHARGYVPAGYTTAVHTCTVCGENSPVATIITPVVTAGAYAAATAYAAAGAAGPGSGSPGSGSGSGAEASAYAAAGANAASNYGSPGSGPGSNVQASAYAAAGANSGASSPNGAASPGSSNAAEYAPQGAGSNSTFTPPMSPSAGSGIGGSTGSSISPPIAIQSHSAAGRNSFDVVGTIAGIAGLVGGLAWQL